MDDARVLRRRVHQRIAGGQRVAHPCAQRQDAIGLAQGIAHAAVHADTQVAGIVRVAVIHVILTPEGHGDRQAPAFGKSGQQIGILLHPDRAAGDDQRAFRRGQRGADRIALGVRDAGDRARCGGQVGGVRQVGNHVLGQGQNHRPGPPRHGQIKGAGDILGDAVGLVDFRHPFRKPAEHLAVIDLLKGFAVAVGPGDLADEQDHRRRILLGDMHAGAGIGGAGATGDEADAGSPGQLGSRLGHHRGAAFLTADDVLDARCEQPVQHREKAFAGDREHPVDPLALQCINQYLTAVPH